jgi:hypothetical protein
MNKIKTQSEVKPNSPELNDAALIFKNAHFSSASLFRAFELARGRRGRPRGMTTDQEQDILRAMLVMACAGLDAALKQLIRDTLPLVVKASPDAQIELEKFTERQLRGEDEIGTNVKYLAHILAGSSTYSRLIESYIDALTGDSLQSVDQLFKALAALGIQANSVDLDKKLYQPIFVARNKIIHELDIDLDGQQRKRNMRGVDEMIKWTDLILGLTRRIIESVDKLIPSPSKRFRHAQIPLRDSRK